MPKKFIFYFLFIISFIINILMFQQSYAQKASNTPVSGKTSVNRLDAEFDALEKKVDSLEREINNKKLEIEAAKKLLEISEKNLTAPNYIFSVIFGLMAVVVIIGFFVRKMLVDDFSKKKIEIDKKIVDYET